MKFFPLSEFDRLSTVPDKRGFTLLEIMVVLAIMGLLVSLAIASLGGIYNNSKVSIAELFVRQSLEIPLSAYRTHLGDYPATEEGLQALATPPSGKASRWHGPYLKQTTLHFPLLDPWGVPYNYKCPGIHNPQDYDVWSNGEDKVSGTADDIGNWISAPAK